jgi:predicted alpha/beta superfamily hydrolase
LSTEFLIDTNGKVLRANGNRQSQHVFLQPVDEHDTEHMESQADKLKALCGHTDWCILTVPIARWNEELTPWESEPVFGKDGFGSGAAKTLSYICQSVIPEWEKSEPDVKRRYYLCGYSLAGLFALWAAYQTEIFTGIAAVSPSVWYPNWIDYAKSHCIRSSKVYLSLGKREEKTKNRVMATVGDAIRKQYDYLSDAGVACTLQWNEGNHFVDSDGRTAKAMAWLLENEA